MRMRRRRLAAVEARLGDVTLQRGDGKGAERRARRERGDLDSDGPEPLATVGQLSSPHFASFSSLHYATPRGPTSSPSSSSAASALRTTTSERSLRSTFVTVVLTPAAHVCNRRRYRVPLRSPAAVLELRKTITRL